MKSGDEGGSAEGEELEAEFALRWLEKLVADPVQQADLDPELLRRVRKAASRIAFPDRTERKSFIKQRRRAGREAKRLHDDAALDATSNRALKRALRFPTAPADLSISRADRELLEKQAESREAASTQGEARRVQEARPCYICKSEYDELHHHYDSLCPKCAELNWEKRSQSAKLGGRVALVTGSRVKIGYEASLMLLRAGATVIATTRFPADSAQRFAAEEDFQSFQDRLHIHGLDLRQTPAVERFAAHMRATLPRLDFLVHNACQTVRRPPAYYEHLVESERQLDLSAGARALLAQQDALLAPSDGDAPLSSESSAALEPIPAGLRDAAGLSQLDLLSESGQSHLFPRGMLDGDGQQLDLRGLNSWRMELADVPTIELIEVQLVNAIAPFVLTARLKPLMLQVATRDKHVVNVSAMEGQFYRALKTTRHPHTNMAKAALNMMTRTSAADFVKDGIHMNSVDTGWVTDEDPFAKTVAKETDQRFAPPLDSIDGAARVLDPIFTGINSGVHYWGQFLKDYQATSW